MENNRDQQFEKITTSISKLLKEKNKRYGDAALNPLNIFTGKSKMGYRIDDKLNRIKNSEILRKNDTVDLIGYLILLCVENGWDDFDDQID